MEPGDSGDSAKRVMLYALGRNIFLLINCVCDHEYWIANWVKPSGSGRYVIIFRRRKTQSARLRKEHLSPELDTRLVQSKDHRMYSGSLVPVGFLGRSL